jgi:very-short-patch-repair endonuclease
VEERAGNRVVSHESEERAGTLEEWQERSLFPFWILPKNQTLKARARELRKQAILSEVVFWQTFKHKKNLGWDIDRQVIIDNYIVDFFIAELGLAFEIDGSSHDDKLVYDTQRDENLRYWGIAVVHITSLDVLNHMQDVWALVHTAVREREVELRKQINSSTSSTLSLRVSDRLHALPPRPAGTPQEGNIIGCLQFSQNSTP